MARDEALAPDLLLLNGRLLTMDPRRPVAEALAIRDGKIVAVGATAEIAPLAGAPTRVIDLDGRTALPGLADCHVHLASDAGRSVAAVECRDFFDPAVQSVADIVARIREWASATPPGQWIAARGSPLQDTRLRERRLPTREELDAAAPNHPVWISFGAHIVVANSLALRERGITRDTPSPQGGTVVKDPRTGEPTGVFRERAQYLIRGKESGHGPDVLAERIALELDKCLARGVTTIHDIIIDKEETLAYQKLARQGRLPVRVHLIIRVIESNFEKWSLLDLGLLQGLGSDWLRLGGIKMSIDGGFTGRNAAFSRPLSDDPHGEHPGLIRIPQDELDDTVLRYHQQGMRICTHAIGDVALDMILDAYEKALAAYPRADHRHRVEHMGNWMMTPERIARARRLGIVPVPNPPFLYFLGDPLVDMLAERWTVEGFPSRTLWDAGLPLVFGSDAPGYYPVDALRDLGTAVAHQTLSGTRITPHEALRIEEALRAQTAHAAWVGFQEHQLGTLTVGKLADVVVLGDDPLHCDPARFHHLPVDLTISGGRVVYERQAAGSASPVPTAARPMAGGCGCLH